MVKGENKPSVMWYIDGSITKVPRCKCGKLMSKVKAGYVCKPCNKEVIKLNLYAD